MSTVSIIDPLRDERWDTFVEEHPFGWISHLSGWQRALEKSFGHLRGHYLAIQSENGHSIRAGLPIFEVRSWLAGRRLVSIPFATLCDPLVSTDLEMETLLDAAFELFLRTRSSHMEIRTLKASAFMDKGEFGDDASYTHHYLVLNKDPEKLLRCFHRTCVRQRIARALSSELTVRVGSDEADLRKFYRLYQMTRKRHQLPPLPYAFVKELWTEFYPSDRMNLVLALKDDHPIAGLIFFKYKGRVSVEFAAFDEQFRDMSPCHLLFWQAINTAYEEGYTLFDFGRTARSNSQLVNFKSRWATETADIKHYYYPKDFCLSLQDRQSSIQYRLMQHISKICPSCASELLGRFCYRHHG